MSKDKIINRIVLNGMFAALAYVLALVAHFLPLHFVPSVDFLNYDPKDIIICISGFIFGPLDALIVSIVVSFIEMITISNTAFYGFIMNIISTCALVLPVSFIYKSKKSFKGALLSLSIGFVSVIIVMTLWNIIITPIYMDVERSILIKNFLGWIILFNVIKVLLNISFILLIYKPLTRILKSATFLENNNKNDKNTKTSIIMISIGGILLIILIIVIILLKTYTKS